MAGGSGGGSGAGGHHQQQKGGVAVSVGMSGAGSKPASPKGAGVSSAELLTLLRHPAGKESAGAVRGRDAGPGGEAFGDGGGSELDAEFTRLYLGGGAGDTYAARHAKAVSPGAQQVDNYGMLGLAELVGAAAAAHGRRLGPGPFGLELRAAGLPLERGDAEALLSRAFVSPWFEDALPAGPSAAATLGHHLEAVLPACYNVQASPAVTGKLASLSDETLFYMFYGMPGDRMQELAARELHGRAWRYHRELRLWLLALDAGRLASQQHQQRHMISPDMMAPRAVAPVPAGSGAASPSAAGAARPYTVFDPHAWTRITQELVVRPEQLEDRFPAPVPSSAGAATAAPAATPVLFHVNRP